MEYELAPLDTGDHEEFKAYCALHGPEHDDSYLPGIDFDIDPDRPGFILRDGRGRMAGALSLLITPSAIQARRARVAILHASAATIKAKREAYGILVAAAARAVAPDISLYLFLPSKLPFLGDFLVESGFTIERVAYAMKREIMDCGDPDFPPGFSLRGIEAGDRGAFSDFVAVRNRNFREVMGSADASLEDWITRGGAMLLFDPEGEACGTIYVESDHEAGVMNIGTISVDARHRHRGLGRALLRSALRLGGSRGYSGASLSVNAANEKALSLYLSEGFAIEEAMDCLAAYPPALERLRAPVQRP